MRKHWLNREVQKVSRSMYISPLTHPRGCDCVSIHSILLLRPSEMQLRNQLAKIKDGVRQFQQQLIDMKPSTELIEKLKEIMAETLKIYVPVAEEGELESLSRFISLDQDLPAEVRALEAFLQRTGGVCGGWEEFDHQAFLKVWTKCGGRAGFRKEAKLYLPSKSQEEMEEHERWYQELIHLQDERREVMTECHPKVEKQEATGTPKALTQADESGGSREEEKRRKVPAEQAREEKSKQKSQMLMTDCCVVLSTSEEEKKLLAQRLKARKEAKRRKEEQAEKQRQARESRKNRMAKVRNEHQFHVEASCCGMDSLDQQERSGQREAKMSPGEELQVGRGEEEDHRRTKRRKQVDGHIVRDPSRLTRPTKGWEERLKSTRPSGVGHIFHMSQRSFVTL
uniref:Coiled-coil domain containing 112 n=1 Tax=Hippocampus comes TaxID=109280 RepID=A0A3Q3D910_HIPCM